MKSTHTSYIEISCYKVFWFWPLLAWHDLWPTLKTRGLFLSTRLIHILSNKYIHHSYHEISCLKSERHYHTHTYTYTHRHAMIIVLIPSKRQKYTIKNICKFTATSKQFTYRGSENYACPRPNPPWSATGPKGYPLIMISKCPFKIPYFSPLYFL